MARWINYYVMLLGVLVVVCKFKLATKFFVCATYLFQCNRKIRFLLIYCPAAPQTEEWHEDGAIFPLFNSKGVTNPEVKILPPVVNTVYHPGAAIA